MIPKSITKLLFSTISNNNQIFKSTPLLISQSVISQFSIASGDENPLHLNQQIAKKSIFGQRIAHGMIGVCFLQQILSDKYKNYELKNLSCKFVAPVKIDDKIEAILKQIEGQDNNKNVMFQYEVREIAENKIVIVGNGELVQNQNNE